jgi:hypothetical protein
MHNDRLTTLLLAHGVDQTWIARNRRTAWRLHAALPGTSPRSRLGGLPDLPEGPPWPTWDARPYLQHQIDRTRAYLKSKGQDDARYPSVRPRGLEAPLPLDFLCQLDLAEFPLPAPMPLPASGLLSFFWEHTAHFGGTSDKLTAGAARVLYTPPEVPLAPRAAPPTLIGRPASVERTTPWHGLPHAEAGWPDALLAGGYEVGALTQAETAFWEEVNAEPVDPTCTVGGYPTFMEVNPWATCAKAHEAMHGELPQGAWHLLLNLPPRAEQAGWNEGVSLQWWMLDADLVARRWDRTVLIASPED